MATYHQSHNTTSRASVGDTYDIAKIHAHSLNASAPNRVVGQTFRGRLEMLYVQVSSIVTAASLTMRLVRDATGDETLVPDVTATISTGIGTTTDGSVAFKIDAPYVDYADNDQYSVVLKTDDGTVTLDSSTLVWSE